jgi:hypothetical protein
VLFGSTGRIAVIAGFTDQRIGARDPRSSADRIASTPTGYASAYAIALSGSFLIINVEHIFSRVRGIVTLPHS